MLPDTAASSLFEGCDVLFVLGVDDRQMQKKTVTPRFRHLGASVGREASTECFPYRVE